MIVLALLAFGLPVNAQHQPVTVILVRHAEKAAEPANDPPLSEAGIARTRALTDVLRDAGVDVIYHTNRLRTSETARRVADSLGVRVAEIPLMNPLTAWVADVVRTIKASGGGNVSVLVGHSNTFAPVIKAFGGPDIEEIEDPRYDDVFILTVQEEKPTKLIRAKYGTRWNPD